MAIAQPRVQAPGIVTKGDIFEVRTLVSHPMENGLRHDEAGHLIPRNIINTMTCRYNGAMVFSADLRESVAANPYISFHVRAGESGALQFRWEDDAGAVYTVEKPLTVVP